MYLHPLSLASVTFSSHSGSPGIVLQPHASLPIIHWLLSFPAYSFFSRDPRLRQQVWRLLKVFPGDLAPKQIIDVGLGGPRWRALGLEVQASRADLSVCESLGEDRPVRDRP